MLRRTCSPARGHCATTRTSSSAGRTETHSTLRARPRQVAVKVRPAARTRREASTSPRSRTLGTTTGPFCVGLAPVGSHTSAMPHGRRSTHVPGKASLHIGDVRHGRVEQRHHGASVADPRSLKEDAFSRERLAGTVDALDQPRALSIGRLRRHPWRGLVVSRARPREQHRGDKHRERGQEGDDDNAHTIRMPPRTTVRRRYRRRSPASVASLFDELSTLAGLGAASRVGGLCGLGCRLRPVVVDRAGPLQV